MGSIWKAGSRSMCDDICPWGTLTSRSRANGGNGGNGGKGAFILNSLPSDAKLPILLTLGGRDGPGDCICMELDAGSLPNGDRGMYSTPLSCHCCGRLVCESNIKGGLVGGSLDCCRLVCGSLN